MLSGVLRNLVFTTNQLVITLEMVQKYHSPAPIIRTWKFVVDFCSLMVEEILFKHLFPFLVLDLEGESIADVEKGQQHAGR